MNDENKQLMKYEDSSDTDSDLESEARKRWNQLLQGFYRRERGPDIIGKYRAMWRMYLQKHRQGWTICLHCERKKTFVSAVTQSCGWNKSAGSGFMTD